MFAVDTPSTDAVLVRGFRPLAGKGARIVVLGTLPGRESQRLREYYADRGNAF